MINTDPQKLNSTMSSFMRMFYKIRLEDYFKVLETHLDKKYKDVYEDIIQYSDADSRYILNIVEGGKNNIITINPDVTIGEMLLISRKLDRVIEECNLVMTPKMQDFQKRLDKIAYHIVKSIMIDPFYELFEKPNGKIAFEKIINTKKERNDA